MFQRKETAGRHDAGLPHRAANDLPPAMGPSDQLGRAKQHDPTGAASPFETQNVTLSA